MTDDEELQRAVNQAEAAVQGLEAQVASAAALRHALSQESLDALEARKAQLAQVLRSLTEEEQAVNAGLARLEQQLRKPGFQVPP